VSRCCHCELKIELINGTDIEVDDMHFFHGERSKILSDFVLKPTKWHVTVVIFYHIT
jgi:hypothetical protein